jgi:hypothetical protein
MHYLKTSEVDGPYVQISGRKIAKVTALLGTVLAAILLIGAIVNLYLVQNNDVKLGLIVGYTVFFAGSVAGFTNARRAELFGSVAA